MKIDFKKIANLYMKPNSIKIIFGASLVSSLLALFACHHVTHRYAVTALLKEANVGNASSSAISASSFSPFSNQVQSLVGAEAIGFLEFQYLSRAQDQNGVRLVEAKEVKSTQTIQVVAEGPSMEKIEDFLKQVVLELQDKYKPPINDALKRGSQEVQFLNREIASLENLKNTVEVGLKNVGPSPTLVSQAMEINQNLVKLKQEFFLRQSMNSPDKIHNFSLESILPMMEGAPIWPKTKKTVAFSFILTLILSAYAIFCVDYVIKRKRARRIYCVGLKQRSNGPEEGSEIAMLRNH